MKKESVIFIQRLNKDPKKRFPFVGKDRQVIFNDDSCYWLTAMDSKLRIGLLKLYLKVWNK